MSKQTFILVSPRVRSNALDAIKSAPDRYMVTIAEPKRSLSQNARLWAMMSDIANAQPEGRQWTPEVWKVGLMALAGHQMRFHEALDGSGAFFPAGYRSSHLSVREMADLITIASEYGDRHGVEWSEVVRGGFMESVE